MNKSILVQKDSYFLQVSRYIHLNPVKAGIVNDPKDYPYSSFPAYLAMTNQINHQIINKEKIERLIGKTCQSLKAYLEFVYDGKVYEFN